MTDFIIKQLPYDLSNQAGLALIGKYLKRINFNSLVDPTFSVRSGIANSDILKSYLGLLCLGKNDFDAIEGQRKDAFFARALGLRAVPSSPTLRQRMDTHAASWFDLTERINAAVLGMKIGGKPVDFGVLPCGYMPLDVDTFAMDNSGTVKEHVGRTYAGVDGYCPLAAYLGTQGFCLELALRPGTQHSASGNYSGPPRGRQPAAVRRRARAPKRGQAPARGQPCRPASSRWPLAGSQRSVVPATHRSAPSRRSVPETSAPVPSG
jgi:hypothetical protein